MHYYTPSHRVTLAFAALLAVAALALTACSGSASHDANGSRDHVARIPTGSSRQASASGGGSPSGASTFERPRSKLFETDKEEQADLVPYTNCLRAHGLQVTAYGRPTQIDQAIFKRFKIADSQCQSKMPLPPIQEDASNPKALIFNRKVAACLRRHGARYVSVDVSNGYVQTALGGSDNDSQSISIGMRYTTSCQHEVSARHH